MAWLSGHFVWAGRGDKEEICGQRSGLHVIRSKFSGMPGAASLAQGTSEN
jgi:hypothetical protein